MAKDGGKQGVFHGRISAAGLAITGDERQSGANDRKQGVAGSRARAKGVERDVRSRAFWSWWCVRIQSFARTGSTTGEKAGSRAREDLVRRVHG